MTKNRWIACLYVCGLLCGVLCACGDVKPTVSEPNSAPTTTTTTATTTSTTTTEATTTTTTATSQAPIKYKQFYCNFLGERVLMTYERVMSLSSSYPIKKADNDWIIVNNDKSFCVAEDVEDKDLELWRYNGQLSDGTRLYCYVQVNSKKIYQYYHDGSGHRVYGENDELAMQKRVKNWLDEMGYHYTDADIDVSMQGEKAKSLGYFAHVFVYNEKDGGIWMNVQKMREGWRIFEMHLSVDNILNEPEWIA